MATEAECEKAFRTVADLLARLDPEVRRKNVLDRTVSCRVSDLSVVWSGRVCEDGLVNLGPVGPEDDRRAQVRLTVGSDDLVALVEGRLSVSVAVATGRLRVQAGPLDLLRLGSFL